MQLKASGLEASEEQMFPFEAKGKSKSVSRSKAVRKHFLLFREGSAFLV